MNNFVPDLIRWIGGLGLCSKEENTEYCKLTLREHPPLDPLPWDVHAPSLSAEVIVLLAELRQELNQELGPEETVSDSDVLHFALRELQVKCRSRERETLLLRVEFYILSAQHNRS